MATPMHQGHEDLQAQREVQAEPQQLDCAWCLAEQNIPAGNGSHGICPRHEAVFLQHAHRSRQERRRTS